MSLNYLLAHRDRIRLTAVVEALYNTPTPPLPSNNLLSHLVRTERPRPSAFRDAARSVHKQEAPAPTVKQSRRMLPPAFLMEGMREGEGMSKLEVARRAIRRLKEVEAGSKDLREELAKAMEEMATEEAVGGSGGGMLSGGGRSKERREAVEQSKDPRLVGRRG